MDTEQRSTTQPGAVALVPEPSLHPGPREYVKVAVVLAAATGIEVGLYYLSLPHALFAALLLSFAALKFTLVALWFMHLRFDSPIFRRLFATGMALAATVYIVVLVIFGALKAWWLAALVGLGGAGLAGAMAMGALRGRTQAGPQARAVGAPAEQ